MDGYLSGFNEGIIFDKQEELAGYIRKFPEFDYMSASLSTSIASQLGRGIIVTSFPMWKHGIPVTYDFSKNKLYVNSKMIEVITAFLKSINPFRDEKKRFAAVLKDTRMKDVIGGICYYGVHSYNRHNRGVLVSNKMTRKFYKEYFVRSIYENTKLTTLSNKVSDMIYIPYINIIKDYYEIRSYTGANFNSSQEKQLNFMFSQFDTKAKTELANWGFDYPTIEEFENWYTGFMKDLHTVFLNRGTVVMKLNDDFMLRQEEVLNVLSINSLYNTYKLVGGPRTDVESDRFPTAPFKELYCTAEPLAQIINSLVKQNKLKDNEDLQSIASKGIAYLS